MLGLMEDWQHRRARWQFRHIHPGTTPAVFGQIWKDERFAQPLNSNKSHTNAWLIVLTETFFNLRFRPKMERSERLDLFPSGDIHRPFDVRRHFDEVLPFLQRRRQGRLGRQAQLGHLLMEKCGKKEEIGVFKPETIAALGDSAFADDQTLFTPLESVADQCPFFKCKHGVTMPLMPAGMK